MPGKLYQGYSSAGRINVTLLTETAAGCAVKGLLEFGVCFAFSIVFEHKFSQVS